MNLWPFRANILSMTTTPLTIRPATTADAGALERLAQLDSKTARSGEHVVAEVHGDLLAAVALRDGVVYADPFEPTEGVVALLRAHIGATTSRRRRARFLTRPAVA